MTTLTRPNGIAPYTGGDPAIVLKEVRHIIEHHMATKPRSLQIRIGPSELGTPCDHCLAAKLAEWPRNETTAWLPFIGTCVHDTFAALIQQWDLDHNPHELRWLVEHEVTVGQVGGTDITGSCDLFDAATGTVIDHKIVGKTTLDKARRNGPSDVYRTQVNLYAQGWVNAGYEVTSVAIVFYPRNAVSLDHAVWWHEEFHPELAAQALERANRLHANLAALGAISAALRDQWITSLPRHPDCFDCSRYPDRPGTPSPLTDLIG